MKEIWKSIGDFPNYEVSNLGNVRSIKRNIIMKSVNCGGYCNLGLYNNGIYKRFNIHRLVAQAFIPNPNDYPCVNHIDGNKQNNSVDNLEWCTYSHNSKHAFKNNLLKSETLYKPKKLNQYDLNGNFIKQWNSQKEARSVYGKIHASECHNGTLKSSKGYMWKYAD